MATPKIFKNLLKYALIFSLFISGKEALAEEKGQLININQNYQIAFTDLGSRVLKQGDIVKVFINTDDFVYLEVIESSAILSKLGVSRADGFQTNLNDFQRLTVGDTVSLASTVQGNIDNSAGAIPESKDNEGSSLQLQIQRLEHDLAKAKEQVRLLQESNEKSKSTLNELIAQAQVKKEESVPQEQTDSSKEILGQLKAHLDNMSKILNEND